MKQDLKNILLLTTGGTIASTQGDNGLAPSISGEQLLARIGPVGCEITIKNILNLDSSNIQPEEWQKIAREIYSGALSYDGIVVTHGTDTMAYTASMMSFMLQNIAIPVVFTGSQLPIDHPLTDAVDNLRCAFAVAQSGAAGILVAFDRKVMLGCRAVKVRTKNFDAFESVNYPYVGEVDSSGLTLRRELLAASHGSCVLMDRLEQRVFLLKLVPGTDPKLIDSLAQLGAKGVIIEAFGSGGMHFVRRDLSSALGRLVQQGVMVAICSQCLYEDSDIGIYEVGKRAMEQGVLSCRDMTSEAAVTKMMWVLGQTDDMDRACRMYTSCLANEVTAPGFAE